MRASAWPVDSYSSRRHRQDLGLIARTLGDDHQGRGAKSLDVELDPPDPVDRDVERDALVLRDDHPSIGDGDLTVDGARSGVDLLVGIEDPQDLFVDVSGFVHVAPFGRSPIGGSRSGRSASSRFALLRLEGRISGLVRPVGSPGPKSASHRELGAVASAYSAGCS